MMDSESESIRDRELRNLRVENDYLRDCLALLSDLSSRVSSSLDLATVLQGVVNAACELSNAKYGALGLFDSSGRLQQFITYGITQEEHELIGDLPQGLGLLALLNDLRQPLRMANLSRHVRSVGFPLNHPSMSTFLGAPVCYGDDYMGSLYLTEKEGSDEFSPEDEQLIVLFASQAALSIRNARTFQSEQTARAEAEEAITQRLRAEEALLQQARELGVVEERNRLAREIHDTVAQELTGIIWQLNAAGLAAESGGEPLVRHLERIGDLARQSLQEVRRSVWDLQASPLVGSTLADALRREIEGLSSEKDIETSFLLSGNDRALPAGVESALLRICQESLSNALKHANATEVVVTLALDDSQAQLTVRDNGIGFDPEVPRGLSRDGSGFGLINIRERARLLGGVLTVTSETGHGTLVEATLPLD